MLVLAASFVPAKAEPTETVPLWPLYYSTARPDGSSDVEVLFSVFSRQRSATGGVSGNMVPVFWGTNYFHVIPFYWHWNENSDSPRERDCHINQFYATFRRAICDFRWWRQKPLDT